MAVNRKEKQLTRIWSELSHVEDRRNLNWSAQLLSPWVRVIESLEMNDQNLGESENWHLLLHAVDSFALRALVAALLHLLWLNVILEASLHWSARSNSVGAPRDGNWEVHEVIEGVALVIAFVAPDLTAELAFEQVGDDWIVPLLEILGPDLWLFIDWLLLAVYLRVLWLLLHSVELIMHPIKEEPQELLGVLLAVSRKLPCHSAHLRF